MARMNITLTRCRIPGGADEPNAVEKAGYGCPDNT
jgi:hypothetical protein